MRLLILAWLLIACGGQVTGGDGGSSNDGGACVDLEPSQFDTACTADPDCVSVASGNICSGYDCICPSAAISASSQAAYEAQLSKVPHGANICSCPALGIPHCVASQCVFCPNPARHPQTLPPGCPDGGA